MDHKSKFRGSIKNALNNNKFKFSKDKSIYKLHSNFHTNGFILYYLTRCIKDHSSNYDFLFKAFLVNDFT